MTPILNSVHKSKDSLQRRRVLLSVVTIMECDCREHDYMTELTPILNSMHKFNDRLQGRRVHSAWLPNKKVTVASKVI
jgi:hypothetical protein